MRWTPPKPIVKTGFSYQPYRNGQKIASVYACISYETGLPLYYRVTVGASASDHNFLSFEEAMLFCDLKLAITEDDCHSALQQHYPSFPR